MEVSCICWLMKSHRGCQNSVQWESSAAVALLVNAQCLRCDLNDGASFFEESKGNVWSDAESELIRAVQHRGYLSVYIADGLCKEWQPVGGSRSMPGRACLLRNRQSQGRRLSHLSRY